MLYVPLAGSQALIKATDNVIVITNVVKLFLIYAKPRFFCEEERFAGAISTDRDCSMRRSLGGINLGKSLGKSFVHNSRENQCVTW